jgi:hypothetical protein
MAPDLLTKIRDEIELRLLELRPALEEYEKLRSAEAAAQEEIRAVRRPAGGSSRNGAGPGHVRAPRGAAQEAIVAALEHGSHTVSELAVVTAMSGPSIRQGLRRLVVVGAVRRAEREGKLAYALSSSRQ